MKLISDKEPLTVFKEASDILYRAVGHTLGPAGSNTAVVYGKDIQANPKFQIINDGKTIIDNLTSTDAEVSCALQTIRESVLSTNNVAGDGTTSTIILINALLNELSNVQMTKFEICRQLNILKRSVQEILKSATHKLGEHITLEQIAETSLGSNEWVNLFTQAYNFVGEYGEVLLEKSNDPLPSLEEIDGVSFNQVGFVPDLFLDNIGNINKEILKCRSIILKGDIKAFNSVSMLLHQAKTEPVIMFYDKMSTDVLRLLVQNILKEGYKLYPISLEGYGNEIMRYYNLISKITNGPILDIDKKVDFNAKEVYGYIEGVLFNKDAVIIQPANSLLEEVSKYLKDNDYHLSTKTAVIKAGANNSIALEEQYRRFEDAIHSCTGAIKYGVCPGGGLTYKWFAQQASGGDIINISLQKPILKAFSSVYDKLLSNCDIDDYSSDLLPKIDKETGKYSLTKDYYVYDSYKVTEQVIINAIDIVISIFSTKVLICDPQR